MTAWLNGSMTAFYALTQPCTAQLPLLGHLAEFDERAVRERGPLQ
jgi:hypothetical protein